MKPMKRKTFEYEIEDVGTPNEDQDYLNHCGALGFRLVCIADGRMYLELEREVEADNGNT